MTFKENIISVSKEIEDLAILWALCDPKKEKKRFKKINNDLIQARYRLHELVYAEPVTAREGTWPFPTGAASVPVPRPARAPWPFPIG